MGFLQKFFHAFLKGILSARQLKTPSIKRLSTHVHWNDKQGSIQKALCTHQLEGGKMHT